MMTEMDWAFIIETRLKHVQHLVARGSGNILWDSEGYFFLHKSEATAETNFQVPKEAISLHHSLSGKITDYKKRPHVFTLRLANWKEYLFQSTQQADMQNWMQALNMAASVHSSPPLPAAVGRQKRFSRPLLPSSSSRLSWQDQLKKHETKSMELEKELATHREMPPDQNAKGIVLKDYKLKSDYLEYELMRFKTYSYLLQAGPSSTPRRGADLTLGAEGNSNGRALSDIADGSADQPVFRAQKNKEEKSCAERNSCQEFRQFKVFRIEETSLEVVNLSLPPSCKNVTITAASHKALLTQVNKHPVE
ncbi:putative PH and SEC7 domain-containing protein 3 isoform X2 [Apostichopus japonicus]|uniref:Putative PH and SEC7 domain-containing protein 3 isoform X2 n=1 Tax=Stichopus japonicus TaxID=307972 RepID=A0A2G8K8X2_STIJA|nr:putative PH and SEC7 domain-containing protein 3 isoform X2 [Apostichopus japonicus]